MSSTANQTYAQEELAGARIMAGLFEMQVGHQQRLLARPVQRCATLRPAPILSGHQAELLATDLKCERNGNHCLHLPQEPALGKSASTPDCRHCEELGDEAIQGCFREKLDCFAALAMTE